MIKDHIDKFEKARRSLELLAGHATNLGYPDLQERIRMNDLFILEFKEMSTAFYEMRDELQTALDKHENKIKN